MKFRTPAAIAAVLAAAACSKPAPTPPPATATAFDLSLNMNELMGHVVDPGAWAFWRASGENVTVKGVESLSPKTEEQWEVAESGAAQMIEAGNLLQLPGRVRDAEWTAFAKQLTKAGLAAKAAAEAKDPKRMFTTGADLYAACVACHAKYVIPAAAAETAQVKTKLADFPPDVVKRQEEYAKAHPGG